MDLYSQALQYAQGAYQYQKRRHDQWRENNNLYRDVVLTNRLTQRQTVNIPIMKETIGTVLSKTDEFPEVEFEALVQDPVQEVEVNEMWRDDVRLEKLEAKDMVDKKQCYLFGRSFIKLNVSEGRIRFEVLHPMDVQIGEFTDPADVEGSAAYIAHTNIIRPLSSLKGNPLYDQKLLTELENDFVGERGEVLSQENQELLRKKNEFMADLGYQEVDAPQVGEIYVNVTEHYLRVWDEDEERMCIYVVNTGQGVSDEKHLGTQKLEDLLGINFFPIETWAMDPDRHDIWSDGIADTVRQPNKVLNTWFSQLVENRTLRNFGMNYYDISASEEFRPQSYEPRPWGWYGVPGNPKDVVQRVDVPDLSDTMGEMEYVTRVIERSTASTATEKGVSEKGQITLGEIELMAANANERITSVAKYYRPARERLAEKWFKLMVGAADLIEPRELFKKGASGRYYSKVVSPKEWSKDMIANAVSTSEREQKSLENVQKLQAVAAMFPQNLAMKKVFQGRALDMVDLTPEEKEEILQSEEMMQGMMPQPMQPNAPLSLGQPQNA